MTAIIYDKRGRALSIGKNSYVKTHPKMSITGKKVGRPEKSYIHAELAAILKCGDLSKAHTIFVSRVNKSGEFLNAAPCPICAQLIKEAGIKHVRHT